MEAIGPKGKLGLSVGLLGGHYENAVATLSRLIAAPALAGRVPEAREEARLLLAGNPNWRIGEEAAKPSMSTAQPFIDGWRLAGLPDWTVRLGHVQK